MSILISVAVLIVLTVVAGALLASARGRREQPLPPTRHVRRMTVEDAFL